MALVLGKKPSVRNEEMGCLDLEELADLPHVVIGRHVGAGEVFVELLAVDFELSADLGDGAVKAAEEAEVLLEILE